MQKFDGSTELDYYCHADDGTQSYRPGGCRTAGHSALSLRDEKAFLRDVRATAEHTLMLMLALLRRAHAAITHVHDGGWNRDLFRGHELYQKTVGVVGYGRLGRSFAGYVYAFEARGFSDRTARSATRHGTGSDIGATEGIIIGRRSRHTPRQSRSCYRRVLRSGTVCRDAARRLVYQHLPRRTY